MSDTPFAKRALCLGLKAVLNFDKLSTEVISYYEAHLDEIPAAISRGFIIPVPAEKFVLSVDLGIIEVPKGYRHETRMADFAKANRKKFYGYNDDMTDANFGNPSRILKPGDKLLVSAYVQVVPGQTSSEERMGFLRNNGAVFVGAQGASLVFEQKREDLPKGKGYASFDEEANLWKDADGDVRVPGLGACSDGDFNFRLGFLGCPWYRSDAFLFFRDLPQKSA